jgi:hypothetical protein
MEGKQIYTLIPKVMADIGAIGKDRKNEKQGYKFRGIDDVYNAANGALSKHGVFCVPEVLEETRTERTNSNGTLLFYIAIKVKYTFFAPDGSSIEAVVVSEGFDSGDKATFKSLSGAQKYAFLQIFCIPTEEQKDAEVDDHEVKAEPAKVVKDTKAKRSDWYYTFRDSLEGAKSIEELINIGKNIKDHTKDLSESELSDLRSLNKKINNKLLVEGK